MEFVSTSISSGGDGQDMSETARGVLAENEQLKFINQQRGYVVCDVTHERWETSFHVLDKVSEDGGAVSTRATFVCEAGARTLAQA